MMVKMDFISSGEKLNIGLHKEKIRNSNSGTRKARCLCCLRNGDLCFITCLKCNYVFLVRSEVGTVYPNPKDLTQSIFGAY